MCVKIYGLSFEITDLINIILLLRLPVGRGGVIINSPRSVFLCFFFRCRKLGCRSWVIPLACRVGPSKHDV